MSRVAKKPIQLPKGVEINANGQQATVKGPKGTLEHTIHELVEMVRDGDVLTFSPRNQSQEANALAGTTRALINNLVVGVSQGYQRKLELVGSARWRDANRLVIIPFEMGAASHRLWQYDVQTGASTWLTDPAALPFRVLAGEWSISPTGEHIVFLNAEDQALWLLRLPDG
jgi:hypothetical protein